MGYNLAIGELDFDYDNDEYHPYMRFTVKSESRKEAPAFGDPTDNTNQWWPSYTSWHNAMRFVGLHDLFFSEERDDALIQSAGHPGCIPLTEKHRREVNAALKAYRVKYPDAVPTYGKPVPEGLTALERLRWSDSDNPECNSWMTRLVWLHYWVNWALDNCERPAFYNS